MSRGLALLIAIVGGATLGYWLLWTLSNALAWMGFSMVEGPSLAAWADPVLSAAIIGIGLICWAFCAWLIWQVLTPHRRGGR